MPKINANGIEIEFDSFGSVEAEAMLLISGLGAQMVRWTVPFCEMLAARGYYVVRFDNRDVGLSTHFNDAPVPDLAKVAVAKARGELPQVPYTLHSMVLDTLGLMNTLGIERAHLVGRSMGGMIAQILAVTHPHRVLSLVAIMSSTANPLLPPPLADVLAMFMRRPPSPFDDEEGYLAHTIAVARAIGSPGYPFDEMEWREQILAELKRAYVPSGFGRQIAAIAATGDIRPLIRNIALPTLIIHGAKDPLILPACGKDIAENIRGAGLMLIDGMGHDLPPQLYQTIVGAVVRNADRSE